MASELIRYDESDLTRKILFEARSSGSKASWNKVLTNPKFWSLCTPIKIMPYNDLKMSLIDDLIFTYEEAQYGALSYYPISQSLRYLGTEIDQKIRINMVIFSLLKEGYIVRPEPKKLWLNESRIHELEDLREELSFQWEEFSEGNIMDSVIFVGGTELLKDMINDYPNT